MGFYRYINYFIKCCIRRIVYSDWFWKIIFLIIMFFITSFLCNKIAYCAETPDGYRTITPTIVNNIGVGIDGDIATLAPGDNTVLYYFPCYEGMPWGYNFEFSPAASVFFLGYTLDSPSIGDRVYNFQIDDVPISSIESNVQTALLDGYALFIIYPNNSVFDYAIWERLTINDVINSQTDTIVSNQDKNADKINNSLTSTEYDENVINIDTSATDDIDDSDSTGLFTTVFENLSNLISSSNWSTVETIEIGLPYVDSKIELRSDILSNIVDNSLLKTLINVAWYSLFGLYVFRFVTSIYHSIKSGNILNGINFDNEVISSTML